MLKVTTDKITIKSMQLDKFKKSIVVEDSAMRGIFTAGVLDSFIENGFQMGIVEGEKHLARREGVYGQTEMNCQLCW